MNLIINGETKKIDDTVTNVQELLEILKLNKNFIIVEHEHKILSKEEYQSTKLIENQKLELLKIVGGG